MIGSVRAVAAALALCAGAVFGPSAAQELTALARLDPARSVVSVSEEGGAENLTVRLALSRPVPWRVRALDGPPRLVVDFRTVDFSGGAAQALRIAPHVTGVRAGPLQASWSRMVLDLAAPYAVRQAGMETGAADGSALIDIQLVPGAPSEAGEGLALGASPPPVPEPQVMAPPPRGDASDGRLVVMLDPGHGGVDPGAVRDGHHEADITLTFARELREVLRRDGRFRVEMTRDADTFLSLEGRIAAARRAGADVFVSIHADAVAEGIARGAQVYTLSEAASSRAGAELAERHNRSDLLAGLDLTGQDDRIARLLMDMARTETTPRTEALAGTLVSTLRDAEIRLHTRPRESAAFAVLKAPDIPSVLVEIGFMSTPGELEKLLSAEWRARAAAALAEGLGAWAEADATRAELRRR